MKLIPLTLVISLFPDTSVSGAITLPSIFSDNMVLQQNSKVAFWDWSLQGQTVRIVSSWNSKDTIQAEANKSAKLEAYIKTTGGPYSIQLLGTSDIQLNNVMLGEVRFCSG